MPTPESQRIRNRIRSGESGPDVDRTGWEADVAQVYALEETAERSNQGNDHAEADYGA